MKSLSIIIPVFNEFNTLDKLLKKIFKLNLSKQIIVVDDGSTDKSRKILNRYKN